MLSALCKNEYILQESFKIITNSSQCDPLHAEFQSWGINKRQQPNIDCVSISIGTCKLCNNSFITYNPPAFNMFLAISL